MEGEGVSLLCRSDDGVEMSMHDEQPDQRETKRRGTNDQSVPRTFAIDRPRRRNCVPSELAAVKRVIERVEDAVSRLLHKQNVAEQSEVVRTQSAVASLELDIERSLNNKAVLDSLVGTEAVPLGPVDAWVNGQPWREEDLPGKVVLLNFCWATWQDWPRRLPQRIAWDEAYRKQGLVILNVTTYHNQRWNDETKRPMRVRRRDELVPPAEQRKAVAAFCRRHQLKFPMAIQTRAVHNELCHAYGGNPQMVLIDRDGKVRLAVNSGQTMSRRVTDALAELFPAKQIP